MIDTRDEVFDRILVDFLALGGTRVSWLMGRRFYDPQPYSFQLQVGNTGNSNASDWVNVGAPVVDGFFAIDPGRRGFGINPTTHYRAVLTTSIGVYTSKPAHINGVLERPEWLRVREIVRLERLRHGKQVGLKGWLLKRMRAGETPSTANPNTSQVDYLTGGILKSNDTATLGTEFIGGYFAPVRFTVDLDPGQSHEERDGQGNRGSIDDLSQSVRGKVIMIPPVSENDVFIVESADQRYYFHDVRVIAKQRNTPIFANCGLRLAPYSDVIYRVNVT